MKILVIEDEKVWQTIFETSLSKLFPVTVFETISAFDQHIQKDSSPCVVIADLRLPDESFLSYLKKNPRLSERAKIIVVSSTDDVDVLEECYDLGIVDYLTKPINQHELVVKTRRLVDIMTNRNSYGLQIDKLANRISLREHEIQLTPRELQIVNTLIEKKETGIHRDELLKSIWKNLNVTSNTVEVHICNIRKKIEPIGFEIITTTPHTFVLTKKQS